MSSIRHGSDLSIGSPQSMADSKSVVLPDDVEKSQDAKIYLDDVSTAFERKTMCDLLYMPWL